MVARIDPRDGKRYLAERFDVLRVLLGVFLLMTAGLKVHGLAVDPLWAETLGLTAAVRVLAVESELLLALWLLSGWMRGVAWLVSLVFFSVLAGVSFWLGWQGQSSCGCFGTIEVHPWVTFGLDIGILISLSWFRPGTVFGGFSLRRALPIAAVALLLGGVGVLTAGGWRPGWLAQVSGEPVRIEPGVIDMGEGRAGESGTFTVRVVNGSEQEVRLVGGTTSCACRVIGGLPAKLGPGESVPVQVRAKFTGSPGRFGHRFVLWTDSKTQPVLVGRYTGRVVAPEE